MYEYAQRCRQLFDLLEDDVSRKLFKARMQFDIEPSMSNAVEILCLNEVSQKDPALRARRLAWKEDVKKLTSGGGKLIIYGVGLSGPIFADLLRYENIDFYGFCDKRAEAFPDGIKGKPVLPQSFLFQHPDECYVIMSVGLVNIDSVMRDLQEHNFPMDHIMSFFDGEIVDKQYFDFPTLYRHGTAFVDAGCFDCSTDFAFSDWCGGEYSKIFAFEPDPENYLRCQPKAKQIRDLVLLQAGVADKPGTAEFIAKGSFSSSLHIPGRDAEMEQIVTVPVTTIDEAVGSEIVGMIKMDIEGMELAALQGAEETLRRDKPLLALSVYHRPGDVIALMDYLNKIVPEYHFWLRHYTGPAAHETVLYASVDRP